MARKQILILLLISIFYIGNANAIPITISADSYAAGTDISHAIPGVTLQQYTHTNGSDTITAASALTASTAWGVSYLSQSSGNLDYQLALEHGLPYSIASDFSLEINNSFNSSIAFSISFLLKAFTWCGVVCIKSFNIPNEKLSCALKSAK